MHRGNVLAKLSRRVDCAGELRPRLALKPDYAEALIHRPTALADLGRPRRRGARLPPSCLVSKAAELGPDPLFAAALGCGAVPKASPVDYVTGLFDQYAEVFDEHLVERLEYRLRRCWSSQVLRPASRPPRLDVLDPAAAQAVRAAAARPLARSLVGVDLSPRCWQGPARASSYDELVLRRLGATWTAQRAASTVDRADGVRLLSAT
jgi:predicted TPR repeat methyltransferase